MDIGAYISTGILECYCLGFVSPEEEEEVSQYAIQYPAIQAEINEIRDSLVEYGVRNSIAPSPALKTRLFLTLYEQSSGKDREFPPLIKPETTSIDFRNWMGNRQIPLPAEQFDNLFTFDLPSTTEVTNFMVWAKVGHDEEEHNDFREFIVLLEGECDMIMDGVRNHYRAGDIIRIPPFVPHYAVITSETPMVAIVQRQAIAA